MARESKRMENILLIALLIAGLAFTVGPLVWNHFQRALLFENGASGTAEILEVIDTGRRHNTDPVVQFRLRVTDASGREYPAEITMPISPVRLTRYQPGVRVAVKYDPEAPERVAIDHEATAALPQ